MSNRQIGVPSPVTLKPVAVNWIQFSVSGSESRHRVVALLRRLGLYGELPDSPPFRDAFLQLIHKTRERFHHHTERNAADEEQTLLPGHARADEHCRNDCE